MLRQYMCWYAGAMEIPCVRRELKWGRSILGVALFGRASQVSPAPVPEHPFPLVAIVVPSPVRPNPFHFSDWADRPEVLNSVGWFGGSRRTDSARPADHGSSSWVRPNGLKLTRPAARESVDPFSRILAGNGSPTFRTPAGSAAASCWRTACDGKLRYVSLTFSLARDSKAFWTMAPAEASIGAASATEALMVGE